MKSLIVNNMINDYYGFRRVLKFPNSDYEIEIIMCTSSHRNIFSQYELISI